MAGCQLDPVGEVFLIYSAMPVGVSREKYGNLKINDRKIVWVRSLRRESAYVFHH